MARLMWGIMVGCVVLIFLGLYLAVWMICTALGGGGGWALGMILTGALTAAAVGVGVGTWGD